MTMVKEAVPQIENALRLRQVATKLALEAMAFAPRAKVEETVRGWFGKGFIPEGPQAESTMARALALAADMAITLPSASGSTAIDRMLRQRCPQPGEEDTVEALRKIRFRLGPVDIYRRARKAPTRLSAALKLQSVLS